MCSAAAEALVEIGPAAVLALEELLKDKDAGVRHVAVEALGKIGLAGKDAVPALTKLLEEQGCPRKIHCH